MNEADVQVLRRGASSVMVVLPGALMTPLQMVDAGLFEAVRNRGLALDLVAPDLHADIEEGHLSASLCHLANISYRVKREINFDAGTEKITGDDEASAMLTRNYRAPYVVS